MNGTVETNTSPDFKWNSEYDQVLEKLATSDYVEQDWNTLRDIIKYKLNENVASYMSDPPPPPPPEPPAPPEPQPVSPESASTVATSPGVIQPVGAKFPPFPNRVEIRFVRNEFNSYKRPKLVLTEEEAKGMYAGICKLLHEFEGDPPFTIQRVCELVVHPRAHFKFAGKYLRAVERALLVTSTIDAFPVVSAEDSAASSSTFMSIGSLREATTPLFSPIPFLHHDARRSKSRSPPMSPLNLATASTHPLSPSAEPLQLSPAGATDDEVPSAGVNAPVIGMVDELDDPSPGHLSDHPTALTSTTTSTGAGEPASAAPKPLFGGSLAERFVKSSEAESAPSGTESNGAESGSGVVEAMTVDETDADKENVPKS